jgi:hypothetical protein
MQEKVWRYQRGNSKEDRQYNTNEKEQNDQQCSKKG